MIKVGLIGVGFMGSTHNACYSALSGVADVQVVAIADQVAEKRQKAGEKWANAKLYETGMELIEKEDVDVIDICLPTYLHTEHAVAAMEKGVKNVFIEKPVCLTEAEMKALEDAKKKNGTRVMVGQVVRLFKEYEYLKNVYDSGELGALKSLSMHRLSPKPLWGWEGWLHDLKKSGSAITDLHIHDVDFIRYLLGEPESIQSVGVKDPESGIPVHVFTSYFYQNLLVNIEGGWDFPQSFAFDAGYIANFEKGTVVFGSTKNPALTLCREDGMEVPVLESEFEATDDSLGGNISSLGGYYTELKYFLSCIQEGREPSVAPLEEGIASLRLINREMAQILD